jgi:hypothetical protein
VATRQFWILMGAFRWWVLGAVYPDDRLDAVQAGLATEPLVALALGIVAVGGEGEAKGTDWATFVVIATSRPEGFVPVCLVSTQVDDSFGPEMIDGAQNHVVAKACVADKGIKVQVWVELAKLEKQGCGRDLFPIISRSEISQQGEVETADWVSQEER